VNKQQLKDAAECEEMAMQGNDKECLGCSCNVCIADHSSEISKVNKNILEQIHTIFMIAATEYVKTGFRWDEGKAVGAMLAWRAAAAEAGVQNVEEIFSEYKAVIW